MSNHVGWNDARVGRRSFCFLGAASTLAAFTGGSKLQAQSPAAPTDTAHLSTGNGEWTYDIVPQWGELPDGKKFGGTHGAIASDKAGNLYVSTQSDTGILVYAPNGQLVRQIASEYPEVHSMHYVVEDGNEVFYTVVQKGTPKENWLFVKMKTDGTVLLDYSSARGRIQDSERVAHHLCNRCAGWLHLHSKWIWRLADLPLRQTRKLQVELRWKGRH
jgi:hypothetical protein